MGGKGDGFDIRKEGNRTKWKGREREGDDNARGKRERERDFAVAAEPSWQGRNFLGDSFFSTVMGPRRGKKRKGREIGEKEKSHSALSHEKYRRKPPKHEFCVGENYPPAKKVASSSFLLLACKSAVVKRGFKGQKGGISRHLRHNSRRNHQNNHR